MRQQTRREFLEDVGKGMIVVSIGSALAAEVGLSGACAQDVPERLDFGPMEGLVRFMQETSPHALLPALVEKLRQGTELKQLVAAAALANARTFGGEDYVGFHTMMALAPAFHMAGELPTPLRPLPVFKVLYRNTNRIQEHGGRASEVLSAVRPTDLSNARPAGQLIRDAVRAKDVGRAEQTFATVARQSPELALNELLLEVQDDTEVHRVVLPYRAWDLLDMIGREHAETLLRQSVRYCAKDEGWAGRDQPDGPRTVLPKMLDQHRLLDRKPGDRRADDAWVESTSRAIFEASPAQAAEIAAAALADGIAPADVGEAVSLAANQLILRDHGRTPRDEVLGKPLGSVHGDSIGVHACDSANAWRNLARVGNSQNAFACLILGAYQVALDRVNRGGDFLHWEALPLQAHVDQLKETDAGALLHTLDDAVRANLQAHAAAIVARYGQLGHPPRPVFDLLLKYAVSEDGSLHAEKYYRTTSEEFASTRPAFRWRQLVALARVTASECGRPAPGYAETRQLLKV